MKRRLFRCASVTLLLLLASTLFAPPARADYVRSFHSDLRVRSDSRLDVTETIEVDFEGAYRHGIYRDIPVRYRRSGGTYSTPLKIESITDGNGRALQYKTSRQGDNLHIRIGDPDRTVTGVQVYRLHYLVRRAVNFFDGQPEIYWNATGNAWQYPIQRATVRLYPPPGARILQDPAPRCYVGPLGSQELGYTNFMGDHVRFSSSPLAAGSGLSVLARLPAGAVTQPSTLQIFLWWLADWWPMLLLPLLTLGFLLLRWATAGRDEGQVGAIPVEWNPPTNLSPAEVGTLVDEHCDMADIVSTLVDLAARGYLVIEELESEKFLFFSSKDYRFIRQHPEHDPAQHPLEAHESKFLKGLFALGDRVTLSSLKERFYTHLPGIRDDIYQSLTHKNLFVSNPETTRQVYYGAGIATIIVAFVVGIFSAGFGMIAWGIGLGLSGALIWLSARAMPAKTREGSLALRQCLGFQRYVKTAEKRRIEVLAKEDPTIFGRLLPYAMVLGVADQWADAFKDLLAEPPDWYRTPYGYDGFSSSLFVHNLGMGMNTMGSTFQSRPAPQSTAGGGGSGFSSGGGFSGGGFGGGGGGSW